MMKMTKMKMKTKTKKMKRTKKTVMRMVGVVAVVVDIQRIFNENFCVYTRAEATTKVTVKSAAITEESVILSIVLPTNR